MDDEDFANVTGSDDSFGNDFLSDCDDLDPEMIYENSVVNSVNYSDVKYPENLPTELCLLHKWSMVFVQIPAPNGDELLVDNTMELIINFGAMCEKLTDAGTSQFLRLLQGKWDVFTSYAISPTIDKLNCIYNFMIDICEKAEKCLQNEFFSDFDNNLKNMFNPKVNKSKSDKDDKPKTAKLKSITKKSCSTKCSKTSKNIDANVDNSKINVNSLPSTSKSIPVVDNSLSINNDSNLIINTSDKSNTVVDRNKINEIPVDVLNKAMAYDFDAIKKIADNNANPKCNVKCSSGSKRSIDVSDSNTSDQNSQCNDKLNSKKAKATKSYSNNTISTSNKYEALSDCDNMDCMDNVSNINAPVNTVDNAQDNSIFDGSAKAEPITLKYSGNWRVTAAKIDELCGTIVPKKVLSDTIRFFPKSIDHYRVIQQYFMENKLEFFSILPKSERPRKVVIKGIPSDYEIDEVKNELIKLDFNVHRVSKLKNWKTKQFMPIYLVDIFRNSNFTKIYDLNLFMGFYVTVQAYQFRGTKQCYNCQKFNHSSYNCTFSPVCVKCAGAHTTKSCTVTDRSSIKCANCGENHTANFGGCSKFPKKKAITKPVTIANYKPANNPNANISNVVKAATFAEMARRKKADNTSSLNCGNSNENISDANFNIANNEDFPPIHSNNLENVLNPESATHDNVNKVNTILSAPGFARLNFADLFNNLEKFDMLIEKLEKIIILFEKLENFMKCDSFFKLLPNLKNIFNSSATIGGNSP